MLGEVTGKFTVALDPGAIDCEDMLPPEYEKPVGSPDTENLNPALAQLLLSLFLIFNAYVCLEPAAPVLDVGLTVTVGAFRVQVGVGLLMV